MTMDGWPMMPVIPYLHMIAQVIARHMHLKASTLCKASNLQAAFVSGQCGSLGVWTSKCQLKALSHARRARRESNQDSVQSASGQARPGLYRTPQPACPRLQMQMEMQICLLHA